MQRGGDDEGSGDAGDGDTDAAEDDLAGDGAGSGAGTGAQPGDGLALGGSPIGGGTLGGPLTGGPIGGPSAGVGIGPIAGLPVGSGKVPVPDGSLNEGTGGGSGADGGGSQSGSGGSQTGGGATDGGSSGNGSSGGGSSNGGSSGGGSTGDGSSGGGSSSGGSSGGGSSGGGSSGGGSSGGGSSGGDSSGGGTGGDDDDDGGGGSTPPGRIHPGWNRASRVLTTLPSTPWGNNLQLPTSGALVKLDDEMRLESIGICPGALCLSRGTARVVETGGDQHLRWGRWVDGVATLTVAGIESARKLGVRNGIHYLVGAPTVSMPTTGEASYALTGATAATFASGTQETGTLSGEAHVHFGSGLTTRVGLDARVDFCTGASYRMQSNGGLTNVDATNLRMTTASTFAGNIAVSSGSAAQDPLGCTSGNCRANIQGGFFGPGAETLGFSYSIGAVSGGTTPRGVDTMPFTGDTINGVGAMHRRE